MSTEISDKKDTSNELYTLLPTVTEQVKEAAEIIQNLKAFGMIHTVKGVVYPIGSHQDFIDRAEQWLYKYHKK
jgi:hypothetical protein